MSCRRWSIVVGVSLLFAFLLPGSVTAENTGEAVILATNSAWVKRNVAIVSGDVVVDDASPGPTLVPGVELQLDQGASSPAGFALRADDIASEPGAVISGDVVCSFFNGVRCPASVVLPVFPSLPQFLLGTPSAVDVTVPRNGDITLGAGDYGAVVVGRGGKLRFSGGVYSVRSISSGNSSSLLFRAPAEVRVAETFFAGTSSLIGADSVQAPPSASEVVFYVAGLNGVSGGLFELPHAAGIGKTSTVSANFYVPNGTISLGNTSLFAGALLASDVLVNKNCELSLDSAFDNLPPVADPQSVVTEGGAPVEITLTGSDPEGGDLAFSVAVAPEEGFLGPIEPIIPDPIPDPEGGTSQPPIVSATVTYAPIDEEDALDAFTFVVTDPELATGMAAVQINPPTDVNPPPPPLDTVVANDGGAETQTTASIAIRLNAAAPDEVILEYAVLTLPTLGALTDSEGSEVVAEVALPSPDLVYTPVGTAGVDSFDFEACGEIDAVQTCDTATFVVTVREPPPLAEDQTVGTNANKPIDITLSGNPGGTSGQGRIIHISGEAAFIDGAEIAGNVADANGDGQGDNHNALPGAAPVLMSAGVDSSGGAGSNGIVRMQVEWDVSSYTGLVNDLVSATVRLRTSKGTVDILDTFFFVGGNDQDGQLTDSDFEAGAEQLAGVVMPVVAGESTFSFDVTNELKDALGADFAFFSIQGRVDESLAGQGSQRGLQVYTTATSNLTSFLEPQLELTTPGVTPPPLSFTVKSLPLFGTLTDSQGGLILEVPALLFNPTVTYSPSGQAAGQVDSFQFEAFDGQNTGTGLVSILVTFSDGCAEVGRNPGCEPGQ